MRRSAGVQSLLGGISPNARLMVLRKRHSRVGAVLGCGVADAGGQRQESDRNGRNEGYGPGFVHGGTMPGASPARCDCRHNHDDFRKREKLLTLARKKVVRFSTILSTGTLHRFPQARSVSC